MTTINSSNPIPFQTTIATTGPAPTQGVDETQAAPAGSANASQGSLSTTGPAGEIAYDATSVNGTDWNTLTNDMATAASTSVSMTQIMTLLIQVMSQMRQEQREATLADAQNALQSGLNAADAMKKAAMMSLVGSLASSTVSIGVSAYTIGATSKTTAKAGQPGQEGAAFQANINNIQAWGQIGNSVGGVAGSVFTYMAGMDQAAAKADEAQAQYEQSIQQDDQAFFQQLGDAIRSLMESWKGTESATHQASQAIYNC